MQNGIALVNRRAIALCKGGHAASLAVVGGRISSMFPDVSYLQQIAEFTRMNDRALAEAAKISRSVDRANARVARSVDRANARVARSVDRANARVAEVARMVEPFRAVIASVSAWEASLTARIAELRKPWALPDHSDQSMMGFARLSRLSDAVHTAKPFSEPVGELVADELGTSSVEAHPDHTANDRDAAAVKAGFNPELIAFPPAAYSEVVFAAGFKFHFTPTPVPQAVESPDPGAVFDPMHGAVLTTVEQRLRHIVEERLSDLVGPNWFKRRVPKAVRERCLKRQEQERQADRPVFAPIQYADFMDLDGIIKRKDNWRQAFKSIFQNREDFSVSLHRLHPVRRAIAHSRPLGKSDVLTLVNEATRIFGTLKAPLVH